MVDGDYPGKQSGVEITRDIQEELPRLCPEGVYFFCCVLCFWFLLSREKLSRTCWTYMDIPSFSAERSYLKPEYADTLELCKYHTCVFVFTTPTQLFMKG